MIEPNDLFIHDAVALALAKDSGPTAADPEWELLTLHHAYGAGAECDARNRQIDLAACRYPKRRCNLGHIDSLCSEAGQRDRKCLPPLVSQRAQRRRQIETSIACCATGLTQIDRINAYGIDTHVDFNRQCSVAFA